jgi:hypothetical protein
MVNTKTCVQMVSKLFVDKIEKKEKTLNFFHM